LATVNENQAHAVWLWDARLLGLACVLLHERPVHHVAWGAVTDRLAICTDAKRCEEPCGAQLLARLQS